MSKPNTARKGSRYEVTVPAVADRGLQAVALNIRDADLAAAFDRIDHDHLLSLLGSFPARERIRRWLQSGVVDRGLFAPARSALRRAA
jgi:hypothetical protein